MNNDRRCQVFFVDVRVILTLLGNWRGKDCVSLPVLKGLPEGYRILRVNYDFGRDAIGLLIQHDSFPEIVEGGRFPESAGLVEVETVRIETPAAPEPRGNRGYTIVEYTLGSDVPPGEEDAVIRFDEGAKPYEELEITRSSKRYEDALTMTFQNIAREGAEREDAAFMKIIEDEKRAAIAGGTRVEPERSKPAEKKKIPWEFLGAPR